LARHLDCPVESVEADTLGEALKIVFARHPGLRGYILDDQGAIRKHVAVFVDSKLLRQRNKLDSPLSPNSEIYIMQALSGG
jgi:hypothetical protein